MKGRLAIFLTVLVVVVVLAALNAASYVKVERPGDSEFSPDRSTFNAGATGTRALFEYLQQTGVAVERWGRPPSELLEEGAGRPETLVVVGRTRVEFEKTEAEALLAWVRQGGRLVVVDRTPDSQLLPLAGRWQVTSQIDEYPAPDVRAEDAEAMTRGVSLVAPSQPTALVRDVAEVTPSRFAGMLHVTPAKPQVVGIASAKAPVVKATPAETPAAEGAQDEESEDEDFALPPPPPPKPIPTPAVTIDAEEEAASPAPVEHVAGARQGALLIDYAHGLGRVVVLADPYIVSNAGINRSDNLLLAANVVAGGRVAFDEYHQGYGSTRNEVFAYFRGTPILWMFAQGGLVVLAFVWTRGRRFARPLPAPHVDRRSKLEFVASMAELQQRAKAGGLAVENIYARTRRALARYAGLPAGAGRAEIAERVAARSGKNRQQLEALMRDCEQAVAGARLSPRAALELARRLRELERDLGILMRSREIRQAR